MKPHIFLFFIFLAVGSFSQNLVSNGGFEVYDTCPNNLGQIKYAIGWQDQNGGNCDYFNSCSTSSWAAVPNNYSGSSYPHNGNAYVGFCMVKQSYFEFLQTKLTRPLNPGKTYCLSFFIKKAEKYKYSLNQLALLFSKNENKTVSDTFYSDTLIKENNLVLYQLPATLMHEWMEINILHKPKSEEQFLSIGVNQPKGINGAKLRFDGQNSYYYVDDISLTEIKKGKKCNCTDSTATDYSAARNKPLALKNITFQANSAILLPASYDELNGLAAYIKANPKLKVELSGHTDNVGKEADNLKLSESRAKAVAAYLVNQGVIQGRISYKGYGSTKPLADNTTEDNKAKNRRVEVIFR